MSNNTSTAVHHPLWLLVLWEMQADLFDEILSLEEKFYDEGFQLGSIDGAKAGKIEGRAFVVEKGFEKYI